jgi:hypothetical protein
MKNEEIEEKINEKKLITKLRDLLWERKADNLKKIYARINLATKRFRDIWSDWWEEEIPPRMEVDLIPIFSDANKVILAGIEVEFFPEKKRRSPYKGLEQALSFGLFGFDSLVLWHIFSSELENKTIDGYVNPIKEVIEGFNLPIVYLATKLEEDRFEFFAPLYSSSKFEPDYLLRYLENLCRNKQNPLISKKEIQRRREVLKIILKIPV